MPVYKRKIFYLCGFDPRGFRFYYHSYKQQALHYAEATQGALQVGERKREGEHEVSWQVVNAAENCQTDYSYLAWDDIVKKAWIKNPLSLYLRGAKAYISYAKNLRWKQTLALPRSSLITFFFPPVTLMLLPLLLFVLAALLLPAWLAIGLAAGLSAFILHIIKSLWLMRFFIFNRESCQQKNAALDERLEQFSQRIVDVVAKSGYDEIVLISHSNGSILAMPLMEKILRKSGGTLPEHFHLLTLGQCIPLVTYMHDATQLRAHIAAIAQHDFSWVDVSYPADGACCATANPFLPECPDYKTRLQLLSPRFFRFQSERDYKRLKRNKFQLHFRYIMDGASASALNFIAITAGSLPLPVRVKQFGEAA